MGVKMRALLLKPVERTLDEIQIDSYYDIQDAIGTSFITAVTRQIGTDEKYTFTLYIDDCGLLKTDPVLSAWSGYANNVLVGNLVISRTDEEGNDLDLSDDDIEYIKSHAINMYDLTTGSHSLVLFPLM